MAIRAFIAVLILLALGACTATTPTQFGDDGLPLPKVYRIHPGEKSDVQFRMLDSINSLRKAAGAGPVAFSAELNAAAATHARDMAVQNRAWHFGSDGSSPVDRARRAGYNGLLLGEDISQTYETELQTLSAWMGQSDTRAVILDRRATDIGFEWFQEENGKLWWVLVTGQSALSLFQSQ